MPQHPRPAGPTLAMVLLCVGSLTASGVAWGDPIVNEDNGHSYDLIFSDMNWSDSRADAESFSEPGLSCHLVTITSAEEQDFIFQNFAVGRGVFPWLGLSQDPAGPEPDGGWEWVTGEPYEYTNWEEGEPNDADGVEDCTETSERGWNDLNCLDDRPYLLECEPVVPTAPSGALWLLALLLAMSGATVVARRLRRS